MKLLTKEITGLFSKTGNQENVPEDDKLIVAKFFNPTGAGTWYATEYDPVEEMFFGFVSIFKDPMMDEWGYFSLKELEEYRGLMGLGIERDRFFTPRKFSEVVKK